MNEDEFETLYAPGSFYMTKSMFKLNVAVGCVENTLFRRGIVELFIINDDSSHQAMYMISVNLSARCR